MKRSLLSILFVFVATPLFAGSFTVRDWNGPYSFHFDGIAFNANGTFLANISAIGQVVADGKGNFTSGAARASSAMKLVVRWAQVAASEVRICQVRAPFWVLLPQEILRAITAGRSWRSARLLVASTPS